MAQADELFSNVSKQSDVLGRLSSYVMPSAATSSSTQWPTGYAAMSMLEMDARSISQSRSFEAIPNTAPDDGLQSALPLQSTVGTSYVHHACSAAREPSNFDESGDPLERHERTVSQDTIYDDESDGYLDPLSGHPHIAIRSEAGFDLPVPAIPLEPFTPRMCTTLRQEKTPRNDQVSTSMWLAAVLRSAFASEEMRYAIFKLTIAATFQLTAEALHATGLEPSTGCRCQLVIPAGDVIRGQLERSLPGKTDAWSGSSRTAYIREATLTTLQALPLGYSMAKQFFKSHAAMRNNINCLLLTLLNAAHSENKCVEKVIEEYRFTDLVAPFLEHLSTLEPECAVPQPRSSTLDRQVANASYRLRTESEHTQILRQPHSQMGSEGIGELNTILLPDDQAYAAFNTAMNYITLASYTPGQRQPLLESFQRVIALRWAELTLNKPRPQQRRINIFKIAVGSVWAALNSGGYRPQDQRQPAENGRKASSESMLIASKKRRWSAVSDENSTLGPPRRVDMRKARKALRPDAYNLGVHPQDLELGRRPSKKVVHERLAN